MMGERDCRLRAGRSATGESESIDSEMVNFSLRVVTKLLAYHRQ